MHLIKGKVNTYNPLWSELSRSYCTECGFHCNWNSKNKEKLAIYFIGDETWVCPHVLIRKIEENLIIANVPGKFDIENWVKKNYTIFVVPGKFDSCY